MIVLLWFGAPILICMMVCATWLRYERTFPWRFASYLVLFVVLALWAAA